MVPPTVAVVGEYVPLEFPEYVCVDAPDPTEPVAIKIPHPPLFFIVEISVAPDPANETAELIVPLIPWDVLVSKVVLVIIEKPKFDTAKPNEVFDLSQQSLVVILAKDVA